MTLAEALEDAVRRQDAERLGSLLAAGADPDTIGPSSGVSLLTVASGRGGVEVVRHLVDAGASLSFRVPGTNPPLVAAIRHGQVEVVRLLLERGADPNEPPNGASLGLAASQVAHRSLAGTSAKLEILRLLLDAGARVDPQGGAVVVSAVESGCPPVVLRLLIAHGADPDQRRDDGTPMLVVATRRGDHALVDVLVEAGADVDARDGGGWTALLHARELGLRRIATTLEAAGADASIVGDDGSTAADLDAAQDWMRSLARGTVPSRPYPGRAHHSQVKLVPSTLQLWGSAELVEEWIALVDHALVELGASEYDTLVGDVPATDALLLRLRAAVDGARRDPQGCVVEVSRDELALMVQAAGEVALGSVHSRPSGMTAAHAHELADLLQAQVDR